MRSQVMLFQFLQTYNYVLAMIGVARINTKCCVPKEDGNLLVLLSNSSQLDIDIFYVTYELRLAKVDSTHCKRYMCLLVPLQMKRSPAEPM